MNRLRSDSHRSNHLRPIVPALICLGACPSGEDPPTLNKLPSFIVNTPAVTRYDGITDDLLTAGLGVEGLQNATPPTTTDPLAPTVSELRRLAIYNNYRALQDVTSTGGFGRLYGPNIGCEGCDDGRVAGVEYIAIANDGTDDALITMMVQVPDSFDPNQPCIITAPSSGSRGVYGAIGTAGEWGLQHGCAVAYTDKGTGTGFHLLESDLGYDAFGQVVSGPDESLFYVDETTEDIADFLGEAPHRIAVKHTHSQTNPWARWGEYVLQSVEFAFYAINEEYAGRTASGAAVQRFTPENTIVIASSVSNGGGSSIMAAELDRNDLIDGIAVSEPNVQPIVDQSSVAIKQGATDPILPATYDKNLIEYSTLLSLYQPCANLAPENITAPLNLIPPEIAQARCESLAGAGFLEATTLEDQAIEAQQHLNDAGVQPEQNPLQPSHAAIHVPQAIAVTYANQVARASVLDRLCGFSFAAVDETGHPAATSEALEATLFATSNGIPPTGGISLIYDDSNDGPIDYSFGVSPSTGRTDQSFDGFHCIQGLLDEGNLDAELARTKVTGDIQGKPTIIVTGRADAILPINFTSRAYYARLATGPHADKARYFEITNAHHLDALNGISGFDVAYVPLHLYFGQAIDIMFDHLQNGTSLPPSQVVHTTSRGVGAPMLESEHVPPIAASPEGSAQITVQNKQLMIPE